MSAVTPRGPARPGRRMLLVVHHLSRAGMEQQCMQLARELARRGHRVTIACHNVKIDLAPLSDAGVRVVRLGGRGRRARVASLPRLARLARAHDLVHCTGWDASLWGRLAAGLAGRPVVVTEHASERSTQRARGGGSRARMIALHNRLLDPFTAATVVVSQRQVPILQREGVRPDSIVHIPNGVPVHELRAAAGTLRREDLGLPADACVIVHVARFHPLKRQEVTYEAVSRLRARVGDVRVLFVGGDRGLEPFARRAAAEGADWASFLGIRHDVPALLGLADLAVLPSSAEALPMAVIEALAVGVPQVVTDVGDVPALLAGGGGRVVSVDDTEAFERACAEILSDPEVAQRLRHEASTAAEALDSGRMADRYAALFEAVLAGGPVSPAGGIARA